MDTKNVLIFLALVVAIATSASAGDPDILTDFVLPAGSNGVDANFFTHTASRPVIQNRTPPAKFTATKISKAEFPALNGQSVSYTIMQYPAGTINPTHTHPRASELLMLTQGSLEVGFVDTTGKLYAQTLQAGDVFIFPKGLLHYQYNPSHKDFAIAISAFGSASAGTVSMPLTMFGSGIDDTVLAKSLKTDVPTVEKLKAGTAPPPPK